MKKEIKKITCALIYSASLCVPQASSCSEKREEEPSQSALYWITCSDPDHASQECIWNSDNLPELVNKVNSIDLKSSSWESDIVKSIPLKCIYEYIDCSYSKNKDMASNMKLDVENGQWDDFLRLDREESAKVIDRPQPGHMILKMPLSMTLFSMTRKKTTLSM